MNREWQTYLSEAGANVSETGAVVFPGGDKMTAADLLCTLADQVLLRVTGDDAESFLQGQFSNDIAALVAPGSQLSTWSSAKGRVLTLFRIVRDDEGYLIQMPADLVEPVLKRLRMFVLMAKVVIEPQPDLVCLGVSGNSITAALCNALSIELPDATDSVKVAEGGTVVRVRGEGVRLEVITSVSKACDLWDKLSSEYQVAGDNAWKLQQIDAGVPLINAETSEAFVLQMLNLQHIDGVSFKKGCFPGQEVVARMQYLGKLKRRMYRLQGKLKHDQGLPAAGADLFNKDAASAVGKVVDAQVSGDGTFRLLAVIAIAAAESPLFLDKEASHGIELLELPYSVEAAS